MVDIELLFSKRYCAYCACMSMSMSMSISMSMFLNMDYTRGASCKLHIFYPVNVLHFNDKCFRHRAEKFARINVNEIGNKKIVKNH